MHPKNATRPILPPRAAAEMYRRNHRPIDWGEANRRWVSDTFRRLREASEFSQPADSVWDDAEPFTTASGRPAYRTNCNGFAPLLKRRLLDLDFPEDCLRLLVCRTPDGTGHMVLLLDTDAGEIACCNLAGVKPWAEMENSGYVRLHGEARGRAWESCEPAPLVGLDKVLEAT